SIPSTGWASSAEQERPGAPSWNWMNCGPSSCAKPMMYRETFSVNDGDEISRPNSPLLGTIPSLYAACLHTRRNRTPMNVYHADKITSRRRDRRRQEVV